MDKELANLNQQRSPTATQAHRVRALLPQIKEAISNGYTRAQIHEELTAGGYIDLPLASFYTTLGRILPSERRSPKRPPKPKEAPATKADTPLILKRFRFVKPQEGNQ